MTLTPRLIAERCIPSVALIRTPDGLGSGFVVRADGRVVTNLHVVLNAREATISIGDRTFDDVRVVAADPDRDLAVLAIDARDLPVLELGDSASIRPGQEVVAIGFPLGLGLTISEGLTSGLRQLGDLELLQVSAPISSGCSGGPLLDEHGHVIAIATLVVTKGQNLNFGVPVDHLKTLLREPERPISLADLADLTLSATPPTRRTVPDHPLDLLAGCDDEDVDQIERAIEGAIGVGAPLYDDGHHDACFRIYEGTALSLALRLDGPAARIGATLKAGAAAAARAGDATAKAWAMRDVFDGVLDVIRRRAGGPIVRQVPEHDASLLEGCGDEQLVQIVSAIEGAIAVGAPLYDDGHPDACFRIYQGAALDLIQRLAPGAGPARALDAGMARAADLAGAEAKAWAMRDAFDGLLDVIERRSAN
jgi:S1-C subfamily serine protease